MTAPTTPALDREAVARAIASRTYAFGGVTEEGSEQYDCGEWDEMGAWAQATYLDAADQVLALTQASAAKVPEGRHISIEKLRDWYTQAFVMFVELHDDDDKMYSTPPFMHEMEAMLAASPSETPNDQ